MGAARTTSRINPLICGRIATILSGDFSFLGKLLTLKQRDKYGDNETPLIEDVNAIKSLENDYAQILYKPTRKYTPTSEFLFERM